MFWTKLPANVFVHTNAHVIMVADHTKKVKRWNAIATTANVLVVIGNALTWSVQANAELMVTPTSPHSMDVNTNSKVLASTPTSNQPLITRLISRFLPEMNNVVVKEQSVPSQLQLFSIQTIFLSDHQWSLCEESQLLSKRVPDSVSDTLVFGYSSIPTLVLPFNGTRVHKWLSSSTQCTRARSKVFVVTTTTNWSTIWFLGVALLPPMSSLSVTHGEQTPLVQNQSMLLIFATLTHIEKSGLLKSVPSSTEMSSRPVTLMLIQPSTTKTVYSTPVPVTQVVTANVSVPLLVPTLKSVTDMVSISTGETKSFVQFNAMAADHMTHVSAPAPSLVITSTTGKMSSPLVQTPVLKVVHVMKIMSCPTTESTAWRPKIVSAR
jgi:hypothetical protein